MTTAKVAIAVDPDRRSGVKKILNSLPLPTMEDKDVLIVPNLNTADPAPGSTHIDTLNEIVLAIKKEAPKELVVAGRSGPAYTREVFEQKGLFDLGREDGFDCLLLDELQDAAFKNFQPPGSHWRDGFLFARKAIRADRVIGLCCLKTHHYGGHFSIGLKLSVGLVHRDCMDELHSSQYQRQMIAEVNYAYFPDVVICDAVEAFYEGGPSTGRKWRANLTFASRDRIALDAVGVAILKLHGTTDVIERRPVFEQDQIKRAVELELGVKEPREIELIPTDSESERMVEEIEGVLLG